MSVIRVGSTGRYEEGWEQIFGGAGARGGKSGTKPTTRKAKAAASKSTPKKASPKKSKAKARRR